MTCLVDTVATPPALCVSLHERSGVFCDWLDVTCSPTDSFADSLVDWLAIQGFPVSDFGDRVSSYRVGSGTLRLEKRHNFHRASASGSVVAELRNHGLFRDYVNLLGSVGHKVTRLDVSVDAAVDAPQVLSDLCSVYAEGSFSFGRKALRTKTIFERRESDNRLTGTWYAGHRSAARVTGRVYDKQHERLQHGIITPPITRYELTFRKDYGCSLWDVLMPHSLFYSHSSGLLDAPLDGYDDWFSKGLVPWESEPVDTDLTMERFTKRVRYSPDMAHLAALAARFGSTGKDVVMREFEKCLNDALANVPSDED